MGLFDKIFGKSKPKQPFDNYIVTITDELVKVEHPKRKTEQIFWKDINEIKLINTDAGPVAPDIWLILIGENIGCSIPHGSEGYDRVYEIVSKYENFDFGNVIKSMSCAENEQFHLWTRK